MRPPGGRGEGPLTYVNSYGSVRCSGDGMEREIDTYQLAVTRAARLVGGAKELALRLQVQQSEVERWITGEAKPASGAFLKVIDILLEEGRRPQRDPPKD